MNHQVTLLDVPSFGHRFEIVLGRLGCKYRYCDAAVLDNDILHARREAQHFVQREMRTLKMQQRLEKKQEAKQMYLNIWNLEIRKSPTEENLHTYVESMEKICELLDLKIPM